METRRDELLRRYHGAASDISVGFPTVEGPTAAAKGPAGRKTGSAALKGVEDLVRRQAKKLLATPPPGETDALLRRLDDVASIAMTRFYAFRYDRVPDPWRRMYTDTLVLTSYVHLLRLSDTCQAADPWSPVTENLDRALITTGGQSASLGDGWIGDTMQLIEDVLLAEGGDRRPAKRQRKDGADDLFPADEPYGRPALSASHECPRHRGWTVDRFEAYMDAGGSGRPKPLVLTDVTTHWPALTDRPWRSREYLLSRTLGGRRLVPVEVGRSYVDADWGQELTSFGSFLDRYVLSSDDAGSRRQAVGYLAQHNLFRQIPRLRNDILIPDLCWADVPRHPGGPARDQPPVGSPRLNAWFGPARTITPLHTDGYHNLLCQVVGTKYVRLYPPEATPTMRPRPTEQGVDMSNTSAVDLGIVEGWDEPGDDDGDDDDALESMRSELRGVEYRECILGPGDTLLIPMGWWHYVRSLSVSFSVSFWWN
ncbi:lysine-specific demethylase 8 [Geosmithia morbida]|uniref:Lysine-specific demethylase 8 n=1 Tax=Geosmithia morbida TaxID=1094350 RepID=A0A9P5D9U0_9HYPO|nr:lysine-specific demethylase 8 [Geosmithia morbida]KAF4126874.1 lysine-specific demethylase 8 [Geosmithia morbida]